MKQQKLEQIFKDNDAYETGMAFVGKCHDCHAETSVKIDAEEEGFFIQGGSVYEPEPDKIFLKCDVCFKKKPWLSKWQKCEVYARVVGYMRPISQWNKGKVDEFKDRKTININRCSD